MSVLEKTSRRWGAAGSVVSEYKTYSKSDVKVYKDGQLISSTDNGVTTSLLSIEILCTGQFGFLVITRSSRTSKLLYTELG